MKDRHSPASYLILSAFTTARYGLRKADKLAIEYGAEDRDLEALRKLAVMANEILYRWTDSFSRPACNGSDAPTPDRLAPASGVGHLNLARGGHEKTESDQ